MTYNNNIEPNFEQIVCRCLLAAIVVIYILLSCCGCKVHKELHKEKSFTDSASSRISEQVKKVNIDSTGIATRENAYDKVTITLPEGGELPDYFHFNDKAPNVKFPKGTTIILEKGTTKEKDSATKKVSAESSQKENSKVEVTKKEMHLNKTVDKTMPAKWEVILFCSVLLIGGIVWHFKKPILSHVKGWITGV